MRRLFASGLLWLAAASAAAAQGLSVSRLLPGALAPGEKTALAFQGANLQGARQMAFSISGRTFFAGRRAQEQDSSRAVFDLALPADVPPGIGAAWLAATNGISGLQWLVVDDLPSLPESPPRRSRESALLLALPVAVDGQCQNSRADVYQFHLHKGAWLTGEVLAQRLGSALLPLVRILDANGEELLLADHDPSVGPDCRFTFQAPVSGRHYLELRDLRQQGGDKFYYRLRLGDFPLVSALFPAAGPRGETLQASAPGGERAAAPQPVTISSAAPQAIAVPWRYSGGQGSAFSTLAVGEFPENVESEPNDSASAASLLALPGAVSGRFLHPRDRDVFRFEAAAKEKISFTAQSRSLGSPCDVFLQLLNSDGSRLGAGKTPAHDEDSLVHEFAQAGAYYLRVEEATGQAGETLVWRVEARRAEPGFTLSVADTKFSGAPGGRCEIEVTAARDRYDGPIRLRVLGLDAAFKVHAAEIPEKAKSAKLAIEIPASAAPGSLQLVRIEGGEQSPVPARTMAALRKEFPAALHPPKYLDGLIAVGVVVSPAEEKK